MTSQNSSQSALPPKIIGNVIYLPFNVDSGAFDHMVKDVHVAAGVFGNVCRDKNKYEIADGTVMETSGSAHALAQIGEDWIPARFSIAKANLISTRKLKSGGYICRQEEGYILSPLGKKVPVIDTGVEYILYIGFGIRTDAELSRCFRVTKLESEIALLHHRRAGHIGTIEGCETCIIANIRRAPVKPVANANEKPPMANPNFPLVLWGVDTIGKLKPASFSGAQYVIVFKNIYNSPTPKRTRTWIEAYCLASKDAKHVSSAKHLFENKINKIKSVAKIPNVHSSQKILYRHDNAPELIKVFDGERVAKSHKTAGGAEYECAIGKLEAVARAILEESKLPNEYWSLGVNHAKFLMQRVEVYGESAYANVFGTVFDAAKLRVFGANAIMLENVARGDKFCSRGIKMVYLGVDDVRHEYILGPLEMRSRIIAPRELKYSKQVTVLDSVANPYTIPIGFNNYFGPQLEIETTMSQTESVSLGGNQNENEQDQKTTVMATATKTSGPTREESWEAEVIAHRGKFRNATDEEVTLTQGRHIPFFVLTAYKERIQGFKSRGAINGALIKQDRKGKPPYDRAVDVACVRLFTAAVANSNLTTHGRKLIAEEDDTTQAFINSELPETPMPVVVVLDSKVQKLLNLNKLVVPTHGVNGIQESSDGWITFRNSVLKSKGWQELEIDNNIWEKSFVADVSGKSRSSVVAVLLYVDGYFFYGEQEHVQAARQELKEVLNMKSMTPAKGCKDGHSYEEIEYASIKIRDYGCGIVTLSQEGYEAELVRKFASGKKKLPIPVCSQVSEEEQSEAEKKTPEQLQKCQQAAGAFLWAERTTRPDIGFARHEISGLHGSGSMRIAEETARYMITPRQLTYVEGPHMQTGDNFGLVGITDAGFCSVRGHSIGCRNIFLGKCIIGWNNKTIKSALVSPHEAELFAGSEMVIDLDTFNNIVEESQFFSTHFSLSEPAMLMDSSSNNNNNHANQICRRSRHIRAREQLMRTRTQNGLYTSQFLPRKFNSADLGTHAITCANRFNEVNRMLGILRDDELSQELQLAKASHC